MRRCMIDCLSWVLVLLSWPVVQASESQQLSVMVAMRDSVELTTDIYLPTGLVDVYPNGYEALLLDSIIRPRYRYGLDREVMMKPGDGERVRIDLWSTAIVFNKGHRIALHISSSNDPRFDANPNTGRPQRANDETRVARNTIHFGEQYPSRLLLPVIRQ